MEIRAAKEEDIPQVIRLFTETILSVNLKDYSSEQTAAWAARGQAYHKWLERMSDHYFIAAFENDTLVGFSTLRPDGYLNHLFVHKDFQGRGVATLLVNEIERQATSLGIKSINTDASITAKPFFENKDFVVIQQQTVDMGVKLTNYRMNKHL